MDERQDNDFKRILSHANIVDIIQTYIKLDNHGKNYFGVCPFHDDHSPSMSVSPDKQIYKCFVCGATGNAFTFVQNYLNISFLEAVKVVADKIGEDFTIHESKENKVNAKYYEIMDLSHKFYQNNLKTKLGRDARKYLNDRGLNDEIIDEFEIGLSLPKNDLLYTLLTKKNVLKKDMLDLGLVAESERGTYDLFRNRIIFPLRSPTGKVNGFSGRIYNAESQSKYINTRETIIFKKRENLYNYHLAAPVARQEKFIVLCEGFMDAIRVYSEGIKNIVATMGTALAREQIELLKKLNVKVIIVMDNDNAGEMATVSIAQSLLKEKVDIGIVRLNGKKDPDEYILAYGVEAFRDNLKNPLSYLDFMENYLKKNKNLSNPLELTSYINEYIKVVKELNDPLLLSITVNKLSTTYNIDKSLITNDNVTPVDSVNEIPIDNKKTIIPIITPSVPKEKIKKPSKKSVTKFNRAVKTMLYYMMNDTDCMRLFLHYQIKLPKSRYRLVLNNLIYYFELKKEIDFADYLGFVEGYEDVKSVVDEIISSVKISEIKESDMEDVIRVVKTSIDEERIETLKKELKVELDVNRKKKLFQEIVDIKRGCVKNG